MARWSTFKEALVLSLKSWRVWLLQFFGNAAIFIAFLGWLRFPDAHWWQLVMQLFLVVATAAAVVVLHGGTLNYFQSAHEDKTAKLPPAFRSAFKHAAAFFVWALVFGLLVYWIGVLNGYEIRFPGYLRSNFPAWLRNLISEGTLYNIYTGFVFLLRVIVPGVLLPFAMLTASQGFRGFTCFRDWKRMLRSRTYWLVLLLVAIVIGPLAYLLMQSEPGANSSSLEAELTSLIVRMFFAYLLSILGWLLTCSLLGRLRRDGQPGTQPQ